MTLATQLVAGYGRSFESRNLRRMMQFAEHPSVTDVIVNT